MGRPVEYTPARRMVMQGVLTIVLGISILMAWLMSRAHAARIYPPKWETRKVGNFSLDVPAGWSASVAPSRFGPYIEVDEAVGEKHGTRQVSVIDEPFQDEHASSSRDVAMSFFNDEFSAQDFQSLDFLGQKGVWIEVPTEINGDSMRPGFLAAFALLPSNRLVWIKMTVGDRQSHTPPVFVQGDIQLFKRIAQSLNDTRGKGQIVEKPDRRGLAYVSSVSSGSTAFRNSRPTPRGG